MKDGQQKQDHLICNSRANSSWSLSLKSRLTRSSNSHQQVHYIVRILVQNEVNFPIPQNGLKRVTPTYS
ncbi:hypothetical protein BVRB_3g049710 [Beta vulgaris subsp. vulgaris]|nr:hypothetical protein BVRB_3g049710 [Beta vulgaris subsp. vulgaris]